MCAPTQVSSFRITLTSLTPWSSSLFLFSVTKLILLLFIILHFVVRADVSLSLLAYCLQSRAHMCVFVCFGPFFIPVDLEWLRKSWFALSMPGRSHFSCPGASFTKRKTMQNNLLLVSGYIFCAWAVFFIFPNLEATISILISPWCGRYVEVCRGHQSSLKGLL